MLGRKTLLVVDDSEINRLVISACFENEYDLLTASDGREGMAVLESSYTRVDCVLLDLFMPLMDGFEMLCAIRADSRFADIPVVVLTAGGEAENELRALEMGASDFLIKPIEPRLALQRVRNVVRQRENERLRLENELFLALANRAKIDRLTGLYNKEAFCDATEEMLRANPGTRYAFVMWNVVRFKMLVDLYGRGACNDVLRQIGTMIRAGMAGSGTFGRINTDHFAICFPASRLDMQRMEQNVKLTLRVGQTTIAVGLNAGLFMVDDPMMSADTICERANIAVQSIKGLYDRHVAVYDEQMRINMLREQEIVNEMESALEQRQFDVVLQPQYNIIDGTLVGAEALVRWFHPVKGVVSPGEFIPIFEMNGFITKLDAYVWERACQVLRGQIDGGLSPVPISVNISRVDVYHPRLCEMLTGLVQKYRLPVSLLRLEITESSYRESQDQLISTVETLQRNGFFVEMDDFGSGQSSLNTLKDVPVDLLKLDMRFLSGAQNMGRGGNIISAVVRMANWLNLPVIAEGVETTQQSDFLKSVGCNLVQGYLYSHPVPVPAFNELLRSSPVAPSIVGRRVTHIDIDDFWNPDSITTAVFSGLVGAAGVFEYHGGNVEALRVNSQFAENLGIDNAVFEQNRRAMQNMIHPDDLERVFTAVRRCIDDSREITLTARWRAPMPGSRVLWLKMTVKVLAKSSSYFILFASMENITEQHLKTEAFEQRSTQFARLADAMPGGSLQCAAKGDMRIIWMSQGLSARLGVTVDMPLSAMLAQCDAERVLGLLQSAAEGEIVRCRCALNAPGGVMGGCLLSGIASSDAQGRPWLYCFIVINPERLS